MKSNRLAASFFTGSPMGPTGLVIASIVSTQIGATIAVRLFPVVGPAATAMLRLVLAALIVSSVVRPSWRNHKRREYLTACAFGLTLAAMNLTFYEGLNRVHLGIAVTLEFVGPLGLALLTSRRRLDLLWIAFATSGILLLTPWAGAQIDVAGMVLVLGAGLLWAAYILLSRKVGSYFPGATGLVFALVTSAIVMLPIGMLNAGSTLVSWKVLAEGIAVATLSSVVTYSFELAALRRLAPPTFGVLMSLEPAVAAIVGLLFLGQALDSQALVAIVCVVVASAGVTLFDQTQGAIVSPQV